MKSNKRNDANPYGLFSRESRENSNSATLRRTKEPEWKVLFKEAEEIFLRGDFEQALVHYYRVQRMKPNATDVARRIALCKGELKKLLMNTTDDEPSAVKSTSLMKGTSGDYKDKPMSECTRQLNENSGRFEGRVSSASARANKEHISVLSSMRKHIEVVQSEFVEKPAGLTGKHSKDTLRQVLREETIYLESREQFWEDLIPPQPKMTFKTSKQVTKATEEAEEKRDFYRDIQAVTDAYDCCQYELCTELGPPCIRYIQERTTDIDLANRDEVMCNLNSIAGNAFFHLDQLTEALKHHKEDQRVGKLCNSKAIQCRAAGNLAKTHHKLNDYSAAIRHYKHVITLSTSELQLVWSYHEMSYAYQSEGNIPEARRAAKEAHDLAVGLKNDEWILKTCLLMATLADIKIIQEPRSKSTLEFYDIFKKPSEVDSTKTILVKDNEPDGTQSTVEKHTPSASSPTEGEDETPNSKPLGTETEEDVNMDGAHNYHDEIVKESFQTTDSAVIDDKQSEGVVSSHGILEHTADDKGTSEVEDTTEGAVDGGGTETVLPRVNATSPTNSLPCTSPNTSDAPANNTREQSTVDNDLEDDANSIAEVIEKEPWIRTAKDNTEEPKAPSKILVKEGNFVTSKLHNNRNRDEQRSYFEKSNSPGGARESGSYSPPKKQSSFHNTGPERKKTELRARPKSGVPNAFKQPRNASTVEHIRGTYVRRK